MGAGNTSTNVHFEFKEDCGEEEEPENPADSGLPEKFSMKVSAMDKEGVENTDYYTWDNYGKRWRWDFYQDGFYNHIIFVDFLANIAYENSNEWEEWRNPNEYWVSRPIDPKTDDIAYMLPIGNSDEWMSKNGGYERLPDVKILGKTCSVWGRYINEKRDTYDKLYYWKRVQMRWTRNDEVLFDVDAITENVPASALSPAVGVTWIK
jgi:hypothetical protein